MDWQALVEDTLRALVELLSTPPRPVDPLALAETRARYASLDARVPAWLDQLGVSEGERAALGYPPGSVAEVGR